MLINIVKICTFLIFIIFYWLLLSKSEVYMCGFVGFVDFKNDVSSKKNILLNMNSTLAKRGPDEDGYYINKNVALGHKRLIVIDPERWKATYDRKVFLW